MTFVEIPVPDPSANNGVYPDPEMERDVYEAPSSLADINPETHDIFELMKAMQGGNQAFAQSSHPAPPPIPETPLSKFIRSKRIVVLLAFIVYMLFAMNLQFLVGGAVFSTLIVWEVLQLFLSTFVIKQPPQQGGLINLLFVFAGVSPANTQRILKVIALFNKIMRDIAIFMFTFVMIHLAWSYLVIGESLSEILDKDFSNLLKNDEL